MSTRVVAIVPTFNRRELFARAVRSVLDQTVKPDVFLILDNASADGTRENLERLLAERRPNEHPRVEVFFGKENLGASLGMRYLFEKALLLKPEWIWIMDDDGFALPDALEQLLACPRANDPETYILESTIIDGDGNWPEANRPALFDARTFRFEGLPENAARGDSPIAVNTGGYCGLLIRREAFERFGLPRSELYLWYDDIEFVLRVSREKGVYLVPRSRIQHFPQALVPHERRWPFRAPLPKIPRPLLWRYYYLNRNWLWMAKQWLGPTDFAVFWAKHMARSLAAPFLFRQDALWERSRTTARAGFDALFDRLGKRVEPPGKR